MRGAVAGTLYTRLPGGSWRRTQVQGHWQAVLGQVVEGCTGYGTAQTVAPRAGERSADEALMVLRMGNTAVDGQLAAVAAQHFWAEGHHSDEVDDEQLAGLMARVPLWRVLAVARCDEALVAAMRHWELTLAR